MAQQPLVGQGLLTTKASRSQTMQLAGSKYNLVYPLRQSRWPRGLRRGSAAIRLLGLWVRIPPGGGG
jgi:hypothetical protein